MTTIRKDQVKNIAVTTSDVQTLTNKTLTQEAWHEVGSAGQPAFQNGWANYGFGFNTAGFFKDSLGIVHLKGLISGGTTTSNTAFFTLPVGYRPVAICLFTTIANSTLARCDVRTNGQVVIYFGHNAFFSLDGITFKAEQ